MSWSSTLIPRPPLLWDMNEAELTAGTDASRIGWVQVGLDVGNFEPTRVPSAPVRGYGYAPFVGGTPKSRRASYGAASVGPVLR